MLLYIVRHGEPDYERDELLPSGWEQARLAAERLALSGIDEIHASPMGRAQQTAQPLSERLHLPVTIEPWAYELTAGTKTLYPDGELKSLVTVPSAHYHREEYRHMDSAEALEGIPGLTGSTYAQEYREKAEGLDDMLSRCGYRRTPEGLYRPEAPHEKHVALFCHAAMTRILLSHMLHIPIQYLAGTLFVHFTGITILDFSGEGERDFTPRLICCGDVGHLYAGGKPQKTYYLPGAAAMTF